jgi:tRNA (cmo5U34)-methyltransferase
MLQEEITAIFDRQASSYDQKWSKLAPINGALHLLTTAVLAKLPATARILCIGPGTGTEILSLAQQFPGWKFTAVEPSSAMLEVLRRRADEQGISSRCVFHLGYLDSLPPSEAFAAATTFLVSQFILERPERARFFQCIAERLVPEGMLVSSDLAGGLSVAPDRLSLLEVWLRVMRDGGSLASSEEAAKMREAYAKDVAILPPEDIQNIITLGGFDSPVQFFQAGMIHAWYAKRAAAH